MHKLSRIALALAAIVSGAARADHTLASGGKTEFQILRGANQTPVVDYAIEELQRWLKEITGADFPIASDGDWENKPRIVLLELAPNQIVNGKKVTAEGYAIDSDGPSIFIKGGSQRGILYGVYGLLEDHLGCHWFTPWPNAVT